MVILMARQLGPTTVLLEKEMEGSVKKAVLPVRFVRWSGRHAWTDYLRAAIPCATQSLCNECRGELRRMEHLA